MTKFFSKLSDSTGVYICNYDYYGRMINDFTGSEEEKQILNKYVPEELRNTLFQRIAFDSIEDQIIESTSTPYIQVAAIALKYQGQCKEVCFFAGLLEDDISGMPSELGVLKKRTNYLRFMKTIDAMREIGSYRINAELSINAATEESRRSLFSANETKETLRRVEALTQILRYLDSDKGTDVIMRGFLQITGQFLGVSEAEIFKTKDVPNFAMDLVSSYIAPGYQAPYSRTTDLIRFGFLDGKKPVILSTGAAALNIVNDEWPALHAKALVALPITINQTTNMYAVFFETDRDRNWKIEELQFLSDAVKVLQNIFEKRIQKNSLASSYASLEQILEHVGCAIIVNDINRREVLYIPSSLHPWCLCHTG